MPAAKLVSDICLSEEYTDFLTLPAYELLDTIELEGPVHVESTIA